MRHRFPISQHEPGFAQLRYTALFSERRDAGSVEQVATRLEYMLFAGCYPEPNM